MLLDYLLNLILILLVVRVDCYSSRYSSRYSCDCPDCFQVDLNCSIYCDGLIVGNLTDGTNGGRYGYEVSPFSEEGPYFLVEESGRIGVNLKRSNIRDGQVGIDLHLIIRLINSLTGEPLVGAYVHVWHANALGIYSGLNNSRLKRSLDDYGYGGHDDGPGHERGPRDQREWGDMDEGWGYEDGRLDDPRDEGPFSDRRGPFDKFEGSDGHFHERFGQRSPERDEHRDFRPPRDIYDDHFEFEGPDHHPHPFEPEPHNPAIPFRPLFPPDEPKPKRPDDPIDDQHETRTTISSIDNSTEAKKKISAESESSTPSIETLTTLEPTETSSEEWTTPFPDPTEVTTLRPQHDHRPQNAQHQRRKPINDERFLRGYQKTNSHGDASFKTIVPGWYQSRSQHIHLEVHVNNHTKTGVIYIGQLYFPSDDNSLINRVQKADPYIENPTPWTGNADDYVFNRSSAKQLILSIRPIGKGYQAIVTIGIDPTVIIYPELE